MASASQQIMLEFEYHVFAAPDAILVVDLKDLHGFAPERIGARKARGS
jgi:hypothetical protein